MSEHRLAYYFVAIIFILAGCSEFMKPEKIVVAEVGNKKLYLTDVEKVIPNELSKNDSTVLASDYIHKWVKQELLLHKADENLSPEQKNVSQELIEYRNSLIAYKYKNELMTQRMDTFITDEQIEEFYLANPENFNLTTEIVKAIFIKVPSDFPQTDKLKKACLDTSENGLKNLREQYRIYVRNLDVYLDSWVEFDAIARNIPKTVYDPEEFLKTKNFLEYTGPEFYYLLYIKDFKLKTELAPLDFVKEKIKNLILNRRKVEFLKQIEENIYTEAVRKKKFQIYNLETNVKN